MDNGLRTDPANYFVGIASLYREPLRLRGVARARLPFLYL